MGQDDTSKLTLLGSQKTEYAYENPSPERLETFPNKFQERDYVVELVVPEFTSLCPKTGQPDFAHIIIQYKPDQLCVETKSLKLYMFSYRNCGSFMETITNTILNDLVKVCQPKWMRVVGEFNARGGISLNVEAQYTKE